MLESMKNIVHPCGSSQLVSVSLKSRISMEKDRQNPTPRLCSVAKVVPQNALLLHSTMQAQCVCKCQSESTSNRVSVKVIMNNTINEVHHLVWGPLHTEDVKSTFNFKWTNCIQPLRPGNLNGTHITRMK